MDVTERKQAEELLRRRREQIDLLSRISLLGEMTASVAHEVSQPLSAIISNASAGQRLVERGQAEPETLREILIDVAADALRAHDVIQNIRNTVKKGAAVRQRIDFNQVVTGVTHLMQATATAHQCEVRTSLAKSLPEVEGDPIQIQQVLINLVNNAFEAMDGIAPSKRKVEITTQNGGSSVSVSIRDHGIGIPAETGHDFLSSSSRRRRRGSEWAWRSSGRSLKPMVDGLRRRMPTTEAPDSILRCPQPNQCRNDLGQSIL